MAIMMRVYEWHEYYAPFDYYMNNDQNKRVHSRFVNNVWLAWRFLLSRLHTFRSCTHRHRYSLRSSSLSPTISIIILLRCYCYGYLPMQNEKNKKIFLSANNFSSLSFFFIRFLSLSTSSNAAAVDSWIEHVLWRICARARKNIIRKTRRNETFDQRQDT